jgi:hypothetical protein
LHGRRQSVQLAARRPSRDRLGSQQLVLLPSAVDIIAIERAQGRIPHRVACQANLHVVLPAGSTVFFAATNLVLRFAKVHLEDCKTLRTYDPPSRAAHA